MQRITIILVSLPAILIGTIILYFTGSFLLSLGAAGFLLIILIGFQNIISRLTKLGKPLTFEDFWFSIK